MKTKGTGRFGVEVVEKGRKSRQFFESEAKQKIFYNEMCNAINAGHVTSATMVTRKA